MEVLAVVPARGGSRAIPRKNIRLLGGRPLIAHVLEASRAAPSVSRLVVSTDDAEIARVAAAWGGETPFLRPAELATDTAPSLPVLIHALDALETREGYRPDWVLLVQPTSPLLRPETIEAALTASVTGGHDLLKTVTPVSDHPHWMCTLSGPHIVPLIPGCVPARRQDLPPVYRLNGAVTVLRRSALAAGRIPGCPAAYHVMDPAESIDVDTEEDWEQAEWLLERQAVAGP